MNEWAGEQSMPWRLPGVMQPGLDLEGRLGCERDKSINSSQPPWEEDQQRGGPEGEWPKGSSFLPMIQENISASDLPCGLSLFPFCPGLPTLRYHSPPLPLHGCLPTPTGLAEGTPQRTSPQGAETIKRDKQEITIKLSEAS